MNASRRRPAAGRAASLLLAIATGACAPSPAPDITERWPINGTELLVHREGRGEPVVIVHGGPLLDQQYLRAPLHPLADDHELIFFDQRLSGGSAGRVDSASMRLDTLVADIEAIRQRLGSERIHLLGHSWGGLLALRYAITHPDRLASLILVSPMPPAVSLWAEEERLLAGRVATDDSIAMAELRATPAFAAREPGAVARMLRLSFRAQFHEPALADSLRIDPPADYAARSEQFGHLAVDLTSYDLRPDLRRVAAPTLLVFGADEPGAELSGRVLADSIPGARLEVIPEAGHFSFLEAPDRFLAVVRDFMAAHRARDD